MSIHTPDELVQPSDSTGPKDGSGLRGRIRRHPLVWFFSLAFLLSWVGWTPYILSENGLGVLHFQFPAALGTSQLLGVLPGAYLGPILSAFLVTLVCDGRPGLRAWTGRMTKWRLGWYWYVGIIIAVPAALTLATTALSGENPTVPPVAVLVAYLPGLVLQMITTGIAEEPGWRDFAMPRLQHRHGPFFGTLILGPLWGVWHLPLFLTEWGGWPGTTWSEVAVFLVTTTAFSFVMTWVFNHTGQALILAMLLHTSVNNFLSIAWSEVFPTLSDSTPKLAFLLASVTAAGILLIVTRGRLGCPPATRGTLKSERITPPTG
ncbi:type II CAAX endopeptidase family protein [Streptomyces coelicoflavus]|uniref:CPBP family intramembrane glutamic endopeptidase n=1 Tax=Streptomyces coelicoflavus TaxID=285562 RepID=UPI002E253B3B